MTMPRWWNHPFAFGFALLGFLLSVAIHLSTLWISADSTKGGPLEIGALVLWSCALLRYFGPLAPPAGPRSPAPARRGQWHRFVAAPGWARLLMIFTLVFWIYTAGLLVVFLVNVGQHIYPFAAMFSLYSMLAYWQWTGATATALGWWGQWQTRS